MASNYISKHTPLRPPSSHLHDLQVHLQTCLITTSECIYTFTHSCHQCESLNIFVYCHQVILQTHSIMASKFGPSWPDSVSDQVWFQPVLATGLGNPQAVSVWTTNRLRFGSRPVPKPDPLRLGEPKPYQNLSARRSYQVCLDPLVPISGSHFRGFSFVVAFRYPTVKCTILTFLHHCICLLNWLPL